jgi:transposase-like protein
MLVFLPRRVLFLVSVVLLSALIAQLQAQEPPKSFTDPLALLKAVAETYAGGADKQLTKALVERAMEAELTTHLGYEKHDPVGYGSGNSRNGASKKKLKGDFGEIDIVVPRDRNASFEPQIVPKGQTRFTGFDDKILSM